jgi:methionine aminopeptidase
LQALRKAAEYHRQVRKYVHKIIRPGLTLINVMQEDTFMKLWIAHIIGNIIMPSIMSRLRIIKHETFNQINKTYSTLVFCSKWLEDDGFTNHSLRLK